MGINHLQIYHNINIFIFKMKKQPNKIEIMDSLMEWRNKENKTNKQIEIEEDLNEHFKRYKEIIVDSHILILKQQNFIKELMWKQFVYLGLGIAIGICITLLIIF